MRTLTLRVPCWNVGQSARFRYIFHIKKEKNSNIFTDFQYTGCLIWVLIVVSYNPYLIGSYNPQKNPKQPGFSHCLVPLKHFHKSTERWHPDTSFWGVSFLS